jgi:hypothetical protein
LPLDSEQAFVRTRHQIAWPVVANMASLAMVSQDWPMWGGTAHRNMVSALKNLSPNGRDSSDEKVLAPKAPSFLAVDKDTGKIAFELPAPRDFIAGGGCT